MKLFIGIDPGLDGATALVPEQGPVEVFDTPTLTVVSKTGTKREYDVRLMALRLRLFVPHDNVLVLIEKVHAMPGQGVRSMFSMGFGLGAWIGVLAGLGLPYLYVTPQRWQGLVMDGHGKGKDGARARAMELFPAVAAQLSRKKDDGRADALLIAEYGRRTS